VSMFDQLISFLVGAVTYEKAVEMLSILDMDTFFKLTEYAVNANVTQTLLTVNEILNQGFDGSLILGGYADHIRNLMVSKSPDTNKLLDVADVFKIKYQEQSKGLGMGFLLNALNLLNEADERYKSSRNPRLLIELALIKLCHISQFIAEIPTLEEVKKKLSNPTSSKTVVADKSSSASVVAERIPTPSIKEDVSSKVSSTRLGVLDRNAFKQQKNKSLENTAQDKVEVTEVVNNVESTEETQVASIMEKLVDCFGMRIGTLLKSIKSKIETDTLIFVVTGKMQESFLEELRPDILRELRGLTNSAISKFSFEFEETSETSRKPYTDAEKLNFLLEKHPLLQEAVEKLKLRLP
jgi:DNA polymerase III subunit gamma/tau